MNVVKNRVIKLLVSFVKTRELSPSNKKYSLEFRLVGEVKKPTTLLLL